MRTIFCDSIRFTIEDLKRIRPDWTKVQCEVFLKIHEKHIISMCRSEGLRVIKQLAAPKNMLVEPQVMDIYSRPGTKVIFAYPDNGYTHDQEKARTFMTEGDEYTVHHTEVGGSHTDVYLEEIPGIRFNSVHFAPAAPKP